MQHSPHSVLGVPVDADEAQIRSAFAARIKEVHPDHGGSGDPAVFSRLTKARADALAEAARRRDMPAEDSPFDRLFDQIDGLGAGRHDGRSDLLGADLDVVVEVPTRILRDGGSIRRRLRCDCVSCRPGAGGTAACRRCGGTGRRTVVRRMVAVEMDCPDCRRTGRVPSGTAECLSPGGEPVEIRIRPGSRDGDASTVRGMGYPGPGGRGNLVVSLRGGVGSRDDEAPRKSRPDAAAEARGPVHVLEVGVVDAAVGATVYATPPGMRTLSVTLRPGTQHGTAISHSDGNGGVVRLEVRIRIPDASSADARKAFEALRPYC